MYKRMLRAVVVTAFSAALAYGALAVGADIGWNTTPAGTVAQDVESGGDIGWGVAPAGTQDSGDIGWNLTAAGSTAVSQEPGDIGWVTPQETPGDIGWDITSADTSA
ncbi:MULTISPECIES: 5'-nucleotidase [unclassified Streptomyces]|uniref:5'-nucleotidase n=1 Tax=unclassified Streptomyces TaxID=2593676 RepID=UPI0036306D87